MSRIFVVGGLGLICLGTAVEFNQRVPEWAALGAVLLGYGLAFAGIVWGMP